MSNYKRKRITMKLKSPNPLFEKWIIEWRDKAREEGSKMEFCFNRALESLRKYPLPFENGRDCKILKGFGDKICQMLDDKLKEHKRTQDLSDTVIGHVHINKDNIEKNKPTRKKLRAKYSGQITSPKTEKRSVCKEYIPKNNSGAFAILVTLYKESLEPTYSGYLSKLDLIREGQDLANTSFTKPDPGSRYTAWSSMKTLITKNLVIKRGNPAKFSLSNDGLLLARKLFDKGKSTDLCTKELSPTNLQTTFDIAKTTNVMDAGDEIICIDLSDEVMPKHKSPSSCSSKDLIETTSYTNNYPLATDQLKCKTLQKHASSSSTMSSQEDIILPPDTFDIILYIDTCETGGSNVDIHDDPILAELKHHPVCYEVKSLKVGDYIWICRDRTTKREFVLPYIIERKRMDDFGKSIKDGRYHEQKFRLKKSGIQNITYLIERYGHSQYVGLPVTTLYQAATNMAIQDGFCIKFTDSSRHTAKYLAYFTLLMIKTYKLKTVVSCSKENLTEISLNDDLISLMTFKEFNQNASKNKPMKVSDLFVKMLIQIKGMSVDRALAIVKVYPTPTALRKAYEHNPGIIGEKLLAPIQFGDHKKTIGQVLSKTVCQLFTMQNF